MQSTEKFHGEVSRRSANLALNVWQSIVGNIMFGNFLVNFLALKFGRHTNNLISCSWYKFQGNIPNFDTSRGFQRGQN